MLVIIPDTLYGRVGAVLSALIVAFCTIGLTMHKDFYTGRKRSGFFCFYTNLSNLLAGVYFAIIAPRLYAHSDLHGLIPHAEFALMLSIMLTFSVFHLILYPSVRIAVRNARHTKEFWIVCIDNFIVHYLVPWLVFAYWLLCSPDKESLSLPDAVLWTIFPLIYLFIVFIRAGQGRIIKETDGLFPYPFLDFHALGKMAVAHTCAMLYGACTFAGIILVLMIHLLFALMGGGHALVLI